MKIKDFLPRFMRKYWHQWFQQIEEALIQFAPPYVAKHNSLFSPLIAIISLMTVIVLVGVAVGAFFSLLASLLVLYFILTKVYGLRLNMGDVFVI